MEMDFQELSLYIVAPCVVAMILAITVFYFVHQKGCAKNKANSPAKRASNGFANPTHPLYGRNETNWEKPEKEGMAAPISYPKQIISAPKFQEQDNPGFTYTPSNYNDRTEYSSDGGMIPRAQLGYEINRSPYGAYGQNGQENNQRNVYTVAEKAPEVFIPRVYTNNGNGLY